MGAAINDRFSCLEVSRQRRYQLRRKAANLCTQCARPALPGMTRCKKCHKANMRLVYKHQGKPTRKAKNTKFLRATSLPDPLEVKQ